MSLWTTSQSRPRSFWSAPQANDIERAKRAIAAIESGGNYKAIGRKTKAGNQAYGKYQVMDFNIPSWTKAALGKSLTPQQFLADAAAQEKVFEHKFSQYIQRYGSAENAAKVWFGGPGALTNPTAKDVNGKTVSQYASDFTQTFGNAKSTPMIAANPKTPSNLNIPNPLSFAKSIAQGFARSTAAAGAAIAGVPRQLINTFKGGDTSIGQLTPEPRGTFLGDLEQTIYGTSKPISFQSEGEGLPFVKEGSSFAPFLGAAASILDLTGAGSAGKKLVLALKAT